MNSKIEQHIDLAEAIWPEDPAVLLAFIAVESGGDPAARDPNRKFSQFYGMLQMGRSAGIDVGFKDQGRLTTKALHGNATRAAQSWRKYMNRYEKYHQNNPEAMAVCWKGGPGTCKWVTSQDDWEGAWGDEEERLLKEGEEKYRVWNLPEYVRRFRAAYAEWSKWTNAKQCLDEEE